MSDSRPSLRVNSALLPKYANQAIRLPCKPVQFRGTTASVATADGGQVTITLLPDTHLTTDSYFEILGTVVNPTTVRMLAVTKLGKNIDMSLVNDAINLMHDGRFYHTIFTEQV